MTHHYMAESKANRLYLYKEMESLILDESLMLQCTNTGFVESACSADTRSIYNLTRCYWAGRSEFCQIVIGESPVYGKILFLDNEVQSSQYDEQIYHEFLVHPVLNAKANDTGKRILIVGGGEGATAREVLKWPQESVAHVDWVDIDVGLCELCRRYMKYADDSVYNDVRLHYYGEDIRAFLEKDVGMYDIIILDLPDPDIDALCMSDELDELYGSKFWIRLMKHLRAKGAIVSHTGPVAPGKNGAETRSGLHWIETISKKCGTGPGTAYHVCIPSFQGEWGFWMSIAPGNVSNFPTGLRVMNMETQTHAFQWPTYWHSL